MESGEEGEIGVGGGAEGVWEGAVGVSASSSSSSSSPEEASSSQLSATGILDFLVDLAAGFGDAEGSIVRFLREDSRSV